MLIRAEISPIDPRFDARGRAAEAQLRSLDIDPGAVQVRDVYFLAGAELTEAAAAAVVDQLLVDPVIASAAYRVVAADDDPAPIAAPGTVIEVAALPGVTDTAAESLLQTAREIGLSAIQQASTGVAYHLANRVDKETAARAAAALFANEVVQAFAVDAELSAPFLADTGKAEAPEVVAVRGVGDDALVAISGDRRLALDLAEMRAIAAHFEQEGRDPTDLELETLAQTWSEHCVHKTFKATIDHEEPGRAETIDSIFDTYIKRATRDNDSEWLRSVFVDNAGIVGFDEHFDIAFKVETHNHPSALEPFGGANTGVGGVVRDIIGVSAYPIATTDVLCFGEPDLPASSLPDGVLHPRRIADGVIAGIEDYGNKMGIPTVNGAITYDPGYTANPLVFCGCLGVLPRCSHRTDPQVGDHVVVLGGSTGRDGLRGATFSSMEMGVQTAQIAGSSVQIGHPIAEKAVLEAVKIARDEGLYHAITDCGAGGLSSAVGEMGQRLGCEVYLERVPLKYAGLSPWEVWLSEAQERIVMAVGEAELPRVEAICALLDVQVFSLGTFTGDGRLRVLNSGEVVGDMPMSLLHDGIPVRRLTSRWAPPQVTALDELQHGVDEVLVALLATPEIRSKEHVVRLYDHEVQGGSVVKPLVGVAAGGPGDAAVLVPLDRAEKQGDLQGPGVALAVGIQPAYGKLDPHAMAFAVVDECFRNLVCAGADPDQVALLDNFCWGNPKLPDRLGGLVRCARGCYEAAVAYKAPFISGKDSLNNEYTGADGERHAIPGTLLISGLGIVPDVQRTATSDVKLAGNLLVMVGETGDELGGSALARWLGKTGAVPPQPVNDPMTRLRGLHRAIAAGVVKACHDCSEGGVAVAAAEMAIGGRLGITLDLSALPGADALPSWRAAYSESAGRFMVEVSAADLDALQAHLAGAPMSVVGKVVETGTLALTAAGELVCEVDVERLERAFRGHVPGAV